MERLSFWVEPHVVSPVMSLSRWWDCQQLLQFAGSALLTWGHRVCWLVGAGHTTDGRPCKGPKAYLVGRLFAQLLSPTFVLSMARTYLIHGTRPASFRFWFPFWVPVLPVLKKRRRNRKHLPSTPPPCSLICYTILTTSTTCILEWQDHGQIGYPSRSLTGSNCEIS